MDMQYRNMGFIIDNLFDKREAACSMLFDLQTLRENDQRIFTGTLDPAETEAVLVNTFLLDDQLRLKIDNSEQVSFFLADTAGGTNSKGVMLNSPAEITITAAAFGDIDLATHRFLTAVNSSSVVTHYRVQLD
jgi:hypothetical protein